MKFYELISRMTTSKDRPFSNLIYKLAIENGDYDEIGACIYYSVIKEVK